LKKLFVGGLPADATEESVKALFSEYGKIRSIRLVTDVFSHRCKGFGFVEMEGHEARTAIARLDGKMYGDKNLKVRYEEVKPKGRGGRR